MTFMTDTTAYQDSFLARTTAAASVWLAKVADNMVRRHVERTTIHELSRLSMRELADLGISRSEIRHLAHEAAYGKK